MRTCHGHFRYIPNVSKPELYNSALIFPIFDKTPTTVLFCFRTSCTKQLTLCSDDSHNTHHYSICEPALRYSPLVGHYGRSLQQHFDVPASLPHCGRQNRHKQRSQFLTQSAYLDPRRYEIPLTKIQHSAKKRNSIKGYFL